MWNPWGTTKTTITLKELVDNSVELWNFQYPTYYQGEEKKAFEQKVIDHFYLREIGQETPGRFLHLFKRRVREIMPRYIELYRTVDIMRNIEDPFGNVDVTETIKETRTVTSSGSTSGTSKTDSMVDNLDTHNVSESKEQRTSDTPQGSIDNLDDHMSGATRERNSVNTNITALDHQAVEGESATESQANSTDSREYSYNKKGNQGVNTYAHDMIEFRQSIIDVDMMIINDLECLFLQIY